jgi:hypothetical protein
MLILLFKMNNKFVSKYVAFETIIKIQKNNKHLYRYSIIKSNVRFDTSENM